MQPFSGRALGTFLAGLAIFVGCAGQDGAPPVEEKVGIAQQPLVQSFGVGTLIIPMGNNHQDSGMLRAYGLVYALLRANVPVSWAILPGKAQGGDDFTITAPATVVNRQGGAAVATPTAYRGGPFIIAPANRTAALPIITAWLAANANTVVHDVTAGTFSADIAQTMTAAPAIAVFEDGNEDIAYTNLNAAGILDSAGNAWSATSPNSFSDTDIKNTNGNNADGALFTSASSGIPAYCHLISEHYDSTADSEVVAEVRSWLNAGSLTHAFMQCEAATSFENRVPSGGGTNPGGRFLTTLGLVDDGLGPPTPLTNNFPSDPSTQYDGALTIDTGSVEVMSLAALSAFHPNVRTLINQTAVATRIALLKGPLDGNNAKGVVTYLAGHNFSTSMPVSTNAQTNGLRLFLNSIFDSPCTLPAAQPNVTLTKTAPAIISGGTVTFTLNYANTGAGPAFAAVLTDAVPAGTTFNAATGGGTHSAGTVTWNLGVLAANASGSVTFTVNVPGQGTFPNTASLAFRAWQTNRTVTSNTTTSVRDTIAPTITIVTGPPPTTSSTSADFDFSASEAGVVYECNLDGGGFVPCTDPVTFPGLALGAHALVVRGRDAGNNVSPSLTHNWIVIPVVVDAGPADAGDDAGPADAGPADAGPADAGPADAGPADAGVADAGASDAGVADAGASDAGVVDAGGVDSGVDAGRPDAGVSIDTDGDGLPDDVELAIGTDPNDADSDDDGVPDGQEPNYDQDNDGDGLINALDPDSDNDGLFDGTEMGFGCTGPGTDLSKKHCIPDGDNGATKTNPLLRDTDNGGATDGSEDTNLNGVVDPGETDPTVGHGADDSANVDSDGDGLSDKLEVTLGSNPNDADSDDDGVPDGLEANPADDTDGDGKRNVLDPDSDNDGLFDGTEMGRDCSLAATDNTKNQCLADADRGATKTNPLDPDTDRGGVTDGTEDANKNGMVDQGETNPNVRSDDRPCTADSQCGDATSARVCNAGKCEPGCRGAGGNGCAAGQVCSSSTSAVGTCAPPGGGVTPPGPTPLQTFLEGGGCNCTTAGSTSQGPTSGAAAFLALALAYVGRRGRRDHGRTMGDEGQR